MTRCLLNLVTVLSLLLCVVVTTLWVRSYRNPVGTGDHVSCYVAWGDGRYTVRSERGAFTLYAPPPPPALPMRGRPNRRDGATAAALVPKLRNDQVEWEAGRWADGRAGPFLSPRLAGEPGKTLLFGHTADRERRAMPFVPWFPKAEAAPPLLRALERPNQFVAAHVALADVFSPRRSGYGPFTQAGGAYPRAFEARLDGTLVDDIDGLRAELTPVGNPGRPRPLHDVAGETGFWPPEGLLSLQSCSARVDAAQLAAVRDQWHRRLDEPRGSMPQWPIAAAAAVLPAVRWGIRPLRRRVVARAWRRRGLCPSCGYDLRATPSRCPECGDEAQRR